LIIIRSATKIADFLIKGIVYFNHGRRL